MRSMISTLLLVALLPGLALAEADTTEPRVIVGGQATVYMDPDRAVLRVGVETQRDSAEAAQAETNRVARAVLAALEELGVPAAAIQTSSLSLQPVYSQRRPTGEPFVPEVVAYRADNIVQVTLADLAKVGPAVDAALGAGANRILALEFSLADRSSAQQQALREAVRGAAAKAEAIAESLGRRLGPVVEAREGSISIRPVAIGRVQAEMAADAGAPVSTGQVSAAATVTLTYALAD